MRILFLVYAPQNSFNTFINEPKTKTPWIDELLKELIKCEGVTIALAVPINDTAFQKSQKNGFWFYGLPNPKGTSIFKKISKRIKDYTENEHINTYISLAINDFHADIIYVFGSEYPFGLISSQTSCPVVIHIQGFALVVLKKWFSALSRWQQFHYSNLKDFLLLQGSFYDYYIFKKRAEREAIILKNCKYFIGRTSFDKRIVALLSPNSTYFHCEEFIRREFFINRWNCPIEDKVICVSILKGTTYKGIELLIEASLLLKKYSSSFVEFRVCGVQGNEEFISILKKKYKKKFNFSKIKFLGKLDTSELVNQLCNSNIYIHPSYLENSPNSICEAMALGMPIIATNVGGISTLIEDEVDGILVQEGEPFSLAGAIVDLTNNYEKAKQLGCNARRKALKRHQPNDILKDLLEIYNKIIYKDGRKGLS